MGGRASCTAAQRSSRAALRTSRETGNGAPERIPCERADYMGARLTMIDRHYGHLALEGREHAIRLRDRLSTAESDRWTLVNAGWTSESATVAHWENGKPR